MNTPLSQAELEDLIKANRDVIFLYLMKRTHHRETAEDLTQETLARIHKSSATFDPGKGVFRGWAFRIAHNVMVSHWEKNGREPPTFPLDAQDTDFAASEPSVEETVEQKMLALEIKRAIGRLPEPEKTVVLSKELKGMKLGEIADRLGLSIRTVSRKLLSAYDLLQADLKNRGITPGELGL